MHTGAGGGDTGTDCIGTALRQKCKSLINITRRQKEPDQRDSEHPWPGPLGAFLIDYGHAEGAARYGQDPRQYEIVPKEFVENKDGDLGGLKIAHLQWSTNENGRKISQEKPESEQILPADLILLSIGFTGHDTPDLINQLSLKTSRGRVSADDKNYSTNVRGVFVAGDMRQGASLVVWAIHEGREAASQIDKYIMNNDEPLEHLTILRFCL